MLLVVPVFWLAEVVWLVVAFGLMVTLLCGIALNLASVFTVVFAVGFVDWPALVVVLLVALLVVLCARAAPLMTAKTAAAITVSLVFITVESPFRDVLSVHRARLCAALLNIR